MVLDALQRAGAHGIRFDRRKRPSGESLDLEHVLGLIVNTKPVRRGIAGVRFGTSHWFCIRKIRDRFYNLDSKLPAPVPFSDSNVLVEFLLNVIVSHDGEIIKVYASAALSPEQVSSSPTLPRVGKRLTFSGRELVATQSQPIIDPSIITAQNKQGAIRTGKMRSSSENRPTPRRNGYIPTRTSSPKPPAAAQISHIRHRPNSTEQVAPQIRERENELDSSSEESDPTFSQPEQVPQLA